MDSRDQIKKGGNQLPLSEDIDKFSSLERRRRVPIAVFRRGLTGCDERLLHFGFIIILTMRRIAEKCERLQQTYS